ncbi:MAG: hypothetical protein JSR87_10500 [Proteobacteria bacterium]|nr:hypothetical protein [Pseudomonadota bacterium]MBS0574788.1 hypothetical protein [Pseudomonadota bacterium]
MPRQNRVTPFSTLIADPGRGLFMGNRGCLHDGAGRIVRPFRGRLWIACRTEFRGRRRRLMQPGHYTELFFLDEAVALAAGHRPCAECRRGDYLRFRDGWAAAGLPEAPRAADMDLILHGARLEGRTQRRHSAPAGDLPDGTFILGGGGEALLVAGASALPYGPWGYRPAVPRPRGRVTVLTPAPLVALLGAGYRPMLHPTATG